MTDRASQRLQEADGRWATLSYHVIVLLLALPTSMFLVVGTVYLVDTVQVSAFVTGPYVGCSTLLGILITALLRHRLGVIRPSITIPIVLGLQLAAVLLVGLAAFSTYILIPAALATACGQLILPALFVYDSKHGPAADHRSNRGLYAIRLMMSLSWIVGPPLAFGALSIGGYTLVASAIAVSMTVGCVGLLARANTAPSAEPSASSADAASRYDGPPFWLLFAAMIAVTSANSLHSIALPLYLLDELHAETYFPGLVISAAALVEVAVIAFLQQRDRQVREETILWAALAIGLLYFCLIPVLASPVLILLAQVLYGAHFALATTVCLPLLKDALSGAVSNLAAQFINVIKICALVGSGLFATGAEHLGYLALLSVVCSILVGAGLSLGAARWIATQIKRGSV